MRDLTIANAWAVSDEARELGERVRWHLILENHGGAYGRREAIRLRMPREWPRARRIVDVPMQLDLLGSA